MIGDLLMAQALEEMQGEELALVRRKLGHCVMDRGSGFECLKQIEWIVPIGDPILMLSQGIKGCFDPSSLPQKVQGPAATDDQQPGQGCTTGRVVIGCLAP